MWWCFKDSTNESILIGCVYRSPSSTVENTEQMYRLLKNEDIHGFTKVRIVGDFNFPAIKCKGWWSGDANNDFIECVRYVFLIQMVVKPFE